MKISNIKINGLKNPVGYAFDRVSLSYIVTEATGKALAFSCVEVSLTEDFKEPVYRKEGADMDCAGVVLDFEKLPKTRYYIRITARTDADETAVSDETCYFETSKMGEAWIGKWIKPQPEDRFHPEFHKSFETAQDKKIRAARLYISGLGLYSARINGQNVTREVLTPYYSNYHYEVQIDLAVCGERTGLGKDIAGGIIYESGGLLFIVYGGVFGAEIKVRPVKGKLPLGWLRTEMAFARKQEDELAGGEMVALCAGLDVQHTLDHGDQLIGVLGAFRVQELVIVCEIACGGKGYGPGSVGHKIQHLGYVHLSLKIVGCEI